MEALGLSINSLVEIALGVLGSGGVVALIVALASRFNSKKSEQREENKQKVELWQKVMESADEQYEQRQVVQDAYHSWRRFALRVLGIAVEKHNVPRSAFPPEPKTLQKEDSL